MKKLPPRAAASTPAATLAARSAEVLHLGRYRDAIEAFKQALRQDPQPQWRHTLDQAFTGRARALAAKGMFKEAAIVLENTRAADGTVAAPLLYLRCLIQQGQLQKAAREVRTHCAAVPAGSSGPKGLAELAAALSLAEPNGVPPGDPAWAAQCRNVAQALHESIPLHGESRTDMDRPLGRLHGPWNWRRKLAPVARGLQVGIEIFVPNAENDAGRA